MRILILSVFLSFFTVSMACAVLPPGEQKKFEEAYLKQADVRAEISYLSTTREFIKGECTALYAVQKVISKPEGFELKEKDELLLSYSCGSDKRPNWIGSFYPWAEAEGEKITAALPSGSLKKEGSRLRISNEDRAFSPILIGE